MRGDECGGVRCISFLTHRSAFTVCLSSCASCPSLLIVPCVTGGPRTCHATTALLRLTDTHRRLTSQSFTAFSEVAQASDLPSGEKARELTTPPAFRSSLSSPVRA